jgi:hypothetical protein
MDAPVVDAHPETSTTPPNPASFRNSRRLIAGEAIALPRLM